jgi:hypothetical protein
MSSGAPALVVVADTTPLVCPARIGHLDVLRRLYARIVVDERDRPLTMTRPHERLDAWHRGRAAFQLVLRFTASLPPRFGNEARQIDKAAGSVVRNTGEGADRWRPLEKVHKSWAGPGSTLPHASLRPEVVVDSAVARRRDAASGPLIDTTHPAFEASNPRPSGSG